LKPGRISLYKSDRRIAVEEQQPSLHPPGIPLIGSRAIRHRKIKPATALMERAAVLIDGGTLTGGKPPEPLEECPPGGFDG